MPAPGGATKRATSSGVPELYQNPFSWTKVASLFTIEQPKGVGFSYCHGRGPCVNTDESTAQDTYEALVAFFELVPRFKKTPFWITGESYAGVYIPMLIDEIDSRGGLPNFKGAAIGNGCWGSDCFYGVTESQIDFHTFKGQAMMSPSLAAKIETTCAGKWLNETAAEGACGGKPLSGAACPKLLRQMCDEVGDGAFNVYNMYDTCYPKDEAGPQWAGLAAVRAKLGGSREVEVRTVADALHSHPALHAGAAATGELAAEPDLVAGLTGLNEYACGGETAMGKWLDSTAVQKALHVSSGGGMRYKTTAGDLRPLYKKLIPKYKMLIYSGNVDACVPTWGSEQWTAELGYSVAKEWHAWTSDSATPGSSRHVLAGYAIKYGTNDFTFATVRGAGHEVPRYKPDFALTLISKFIKGDPI